MQRLTSLVGNKKSHQYIESIILTTELIVYRRLNFEDAKQGPQTIVTILDRYNFYSKQDAMILAHLEE